MMNIAWKCKSFGEMNSHELYAVMRLRSEVFIVEQNCVYQDADNKDQKSFHLMGWAGDDLAAYARLVPKGVSFPHPSIGRVITSAKYRGAGAGKALMRQAIDYSNQLFGQQPIKIGAQVYLQKFYESFGFQQVSEQYLEDEIPHIEMLKEL